MSIQDIVSLGQFNSPVTRTLLPGTRDFKSDSGFILSELVTAPAMRWQVNLLGAQWSDIAPMLQLLHEMRAATEIFTLDDVELNRKFTVRLRSGLQIDSVLDEFANTALVFEEAIGETMLEYPSSPSIFLEAEEAVASGAWTLVTGAGRAISGGNSDIMRSTTVGDTLTWSYGGYGLMIWAAGAGSIDIILNGVNLGTVSLVGKTFAAAAFTNLSVPLDVNTVRIDHTGAGTVDIDALEFIYTAKVTV